MKLVRIALVVSLLAVALAIPGLTATAAPPSAATASVKATASSACTGVIHLGGKRFAFFRRRVTCDGARRALRRLYETRGRRGTPRGFRCRSRSRFRRAGACRNSTGSRYFGFSG
jgi:hypothetical protein